MQPLDITPLSYQAGGRPVFLYSGEFHYFRVPRPDWRRRMRLFKEAGGNCIATYVPWLIHEPAEGDFRFGGDDGVHDLEGFLELAAEEGLYVIARPGPYQYSELKYDGLPGWLCEGYPELHAQALDGRPFRTSSISYLHPLFLHKVAAWFARVCPIIARHTVSRGGPVAFTQLDNEMAGIHVWFGSLDYNAETMGIGRPGGRYPRFLAQRYGDIAALNRACGTACAAFEEVRPISPQPSGRPEDMIRAKDYFDFYLGTLAEYSQALAALMRDAGIDTPFIHNAANPGMNPYFSDTARAMGAAYLLGSDHYYNLDQSWAQNNPTPQYAVNAFVSLEELRLMGYPPTVFELPSGSLSDWPPITPEDARACYLANIALGMKGSNFYIYTGGPNPPGAGVTTDVYDYGAPIGAGGEVRPLYHVQKEIGAYLQAYPDLAAAYRESDCRVGLDFEAARADAYWKARGPFQLSSPEAWDFLRRGVLTTALCASLSPSLVDLGAADWTADTATPVIVVASSSMSAARQANVVEFLRRGGRALILPVLPSVDERLQPCALLADFLGSPALEANPSYYSRLTVAGVVNVWNNGEAWLGARLPDGAEEIGRDEFSGRPVAWRQRLAGGGQAIVLGARWSHARREHEQMLAALLALLGLKQKVACSNPNVWASLRTHGDRSWLFLMNLFSAPMQADASCRPAWSRTIRATGRRSLAPMSVEVIELF